MADKKTVEKVKELLNGHCYAPLREAAEKWLAAADNKYGDKIDELKEKAAPAMEKLGDMAEKYSDFAIDAGDKLKDVSDKVSVGADKLADKAGPVIDDLKEKAAPKVEELKAKAAPAVDKVLESELIAQLKEGIATLTETIDVFSKPEVEEKFGKEAAEQIRSHAEKLKAEGKKFCDCPACTKAREILKDLGIEIEDVAEEATEE
jgi:uncharacterized protein YaaN involved in tellurite resistance